MKKKVKSDIFPRTLEELRLLIAAVKWGDIALTDEGRREVHRKVCQFCELPYTLSAWRAEGIKNLRLLVQWSELKLTKVPSSTLATMTMVAGRNDDEVDT